MKAVLFDAAGTLIQLREPLGETYARLAREFGVSLPGDRIELAFGRAFEQMPPMVFPNQPVEQTHACERAWWQDLVRNTFRAADAAVEFTDFERYFDRLFAHFARPASWEAVPGARALLTTLRARRLQIGIVSNFDHRLLVLLDGLRLSPFLDVVIRPARTEQIALRLSKEDLETLRRLAKDKGVGHTTLARGIVEQWLARSRRKGVTARFSRHSSA